MDANIAPGHDDQERRHTASGTLWLPRSNRAFISKSFAS